MRLKVDGTSIEKVTADWLMVPIFESDKTDESLTALDKALDGLISRMRKSSDVTGKLAELVPVLDAPALAAKRLLFVGLGKREELNASRLNKAFMTAARHASTKKEMDVAVLAPTADLGELSGEDMVEGIVAALIVGSVGQDRYRAEPARFPFKSMHVLSGTGKVKPAIRDAGDHGQIMGEAINLSRELVDRGPHDIFPASFAERAKSLAREHGLKCEVFDENRLAKEKMQAMLAVAVGSAQPPRMVLLRYQGASAKAPTLGLCGKGVTFDSGGLSLKPTDGMKTMKCDMAGAATVLGAMTAIARLKLPVNVLGAMGLVENMPGGKAYKLGDILTARNGVTIEVLNTDAEGRLVLADVLSYVVDQKVARLVDLATLTGACVVALGEDVTGVFANDQEWCDDVLAAAKTSGEDAWQLPIFDHYAELIKGDVADINNTGGRWGGAITAAKFLERFVGDIPWVHLDIAGPSFASSNKPYREGGGTGCMVRTLVELAQQFGATNKK